MDRSESGLQITLIVNPVSGGGESRRAAGRARVRFEGRGHTVRSIRTRPGTHLPDLARQVVAQGAERVVAVGGDGTVTEIAEGLLSSGREVPVAIIPQGTANVLALNLGIPRDIDAAIGAALEGQPIKIDVGWVNERLFLISAATGSHAEMVAAADRRLKSRLGVIAYAVAWLKSRRSLEPSSYTIAANGHVQHVEATMVQVMNCGAVFQRAWKFAPGISPVDGQLDAIAYRARSVAEYVTAAAYVLRGAPTETDLVDHWRAAQFRIDADPPVRLQRDGEVAGHTPARIHIEPRALPVVVPEASPWAA